MTKLLSKWVSTILNTLKFKAPDTYPMFPISSDLGMIINHFPADFAEVFRLGDGSQSRKQKVLEREVRRNVEGSDSGVHQQLREKP